ncbi:hypothetical protein MUB24_13475 [Lederbergia sp. NSJ-179]|uniref:hypothetical protein n=1 Tax=Lederbergia sp. NSJ-179 TaxID=2931402 RepID=UPI001FD588DF|nr:hypothetical protein [Lederbergia sp. NSJ-179]MCJ7841890.1 hypothetical protein [Lederbergia sp. NSJ-179]
MINIDKAKESLFALKNKPKFERMLHTAAIFTELMEQQNIEPIIVGGLSVEIYSLNGYTTHDIDFVLDGYDKANDILHSLGFEKIGKDWFHPEIGVSVEIPDNYLAGDYGKVTTVPVGKRKVNVIGIEDIILDRLRAAVHWKSAQDREWGFRLFLMYMEDIDLDYMESKLETPTEKIELDHWRNEAKYEKE